MRVLITNTGPWGTGSATVTDGVARELMNLGHKVKVVFPDVGFETDDKDIYYGNPKVYNILKFPVDYKNTCLYTFPLIISDPNPRNYRKAWTFKDLSKREMDAYFNYFKERIIKIIDLFEPDIIECQHIWAMDFIIHELGLPYVSVAHHSDQLGFKQDKRMRHYAKEAAKSARYIFAVSKMVRNEVLQLYFVDPEKVIVLPNGYDQRTFFPKQLSKTKVLHSLGIKNKNDLPVVTFAGKISKTKGVDVLLEANKIIQKKFPAIFLLFGSGELQDILNESREYELKNVHLMGHHRSETLAKAHKIAKLSVLPSRTEGFGIAALEAMGCGTPVVATKSGGPEEFITELVEPDDPINLANGIIKILELDDEEYMNVRHRALQVAKKYSWGWIVKERIKYYKKALKKQG